MARAASVDLEGTYPLRSVARLTGLSPQLLRAWERRYGVVEPLRTPGGTRRYRASDLERLRLFKAAADRGHRIGSLAGLSDAELEQLGSPVAVSSRDRIDAILGALDALDGPEAQRLLGLQLAALGAARFSREVAMPLVREIGERWVDRRMRIASEHLATGVLRSLLGSALQPDAAALRGVRIVFATLPGERHELGLLMAALASMGAGANPLYLGPELPVDELLHAVERSAARALALSVVAMAPDEAARHVAAVRAGLPADVRLWIGGAGARPVALPRGVERTDRFEQLEQWIGLLAFESPPRR